MTRTHHLISSSMLALLLVAAVSSAQAPAVDDSPQVDEPTDVAALPTPAIDGNPQSTRSLLRRSAAVVQGNVRRISYTYDERTGPRTVVTLAVSDVLAGTFSESTVELRLFGGPADDGSSYSTSESITFVEGAAYVLFLRNEPWFFVPTVGAALRVQDIGGRRVLMDTEGHPLRRLSPRGMTFGEPPADPEAGTSAWTDALDVVTFGGLLDEAMRAERVAPSGRFSPAPLQRRNWRDTEAEPTPTAQVAPTSKPESLRNMEEP